MGVAGPRLGSLAELSLRPCPPFPGGRQLPVGRRRRGSPWPPGSPKARPPSRCPPAGGRPSCRSQNWPNQSSASHLPTAGDPWPIARGLFAGSGQAQPIGTAPRPSGAGRGRGAGGKGCPGGRLDLAALTAPQPCEPRGGSRRGARQWPPLPPLEAQRAGALANGFLAGQLRSE